VKNNVESVSKKLQNATRMLTNWAERNDVSLSVTKTKAIVCGDTANNITIDIEGAAIEIVSSHKYLGMILESRVIYSRCYIT